VSTTVQQAPGLFRTDIQHAALSVPGRVIIQNRVEIGPEAPFVRHKHPGEEIIYVLEGTLDTPSTASRRSRSVPATA
jgi:quercetin dioxygenase-like cupin family protein